jgi:hypothetical protein
MKYAISNQDGLIIYDVTIEEFETAKENNQLVWVSYDDGVTYILYVGAS